MSGIILINGLILITFFSCTPPHTRIPSTVIPSDNLPLQPILPNPQSTVKPYNRASKNILIKLINGLNQPIQDGLVTVSGPGIFPLELKSDQNGTVKLQNVVADQFYNLKIEATGYTLKTANHIKLPSSLAPVTFKLSKEKYIFGQLLSENGNPIDQMTIAYQNGRTALSNKEGQFKLQYETEFPTKINFSRQGFVKQLKDLSKSSLTIYNLGSINLQTQPDPLKALIYLKNHTQLKKENVSLLSGLFAKQDFNVQMIDNAPLPELLNIDLLLIPSPNYKFSPNELIQITSFVANGGKLIVLGEWSGYGEFNIAHANLILEPFGLQFGNDLLRESISSNNGNITVSTITPHYLTEGIEHLQLYQATSVYLSKQTSQSEIIARVKDNAFRIANTSTNLKLGSFGVIGVSIFGNGKVIAIGDTSLWLNDNSDKNQIPNLQEGQNQLLAQRIFDW